MNGPRSQASPQGDPATPRTLVEACARLLRPGGVSRGLRLVDERGRASYLAYSDLLVEAAAAGRAMDRAGLRRRDRVLLLLPTSRTLVVTIVGCLLRGIVPFPGDAGSTWSRREDAPAELLALARAAGVRAIVSTARRGTALAAQLGPGDPGVLSVDRLRHAPAIGSDEPAVSVRPDDGAVLIATSGATGPRRPVLLTHANVCAHLAALGRVLRIGEREVICGFSGLDGVTGLVDQLLLGLYFGLDQVLLAPDWVTGQPSRWLRAVASYRCTLTLAEDSAFGLAAHRLQDAELGGEGLDLSCLRRAVSVGATVRPGTQEAFLRRFGRHGIHAALFLPAYGLAEAGGIFTLGRPGALPLSDRFDRRSLRPGCSVHSAGTADARGRLISSSGAPLPGHQLRIADAAGQALDEGTVGRVLVRGPAVALAPLPGAEAPDAGDWLDSGDLGFVMEGELFVVGRHGEALELDGFCYEPGEIEAVAREIPGIRSGGMAAFAIAEATGEKPVIVAAAESALGTERRERLAAKLGVRIGRSIGVRPEVVLVPARSLPRWGRGQRHREGVRERYLEAWDDDEEPA